MHLVSPPSFMWASLSDLLRWFWCRNKYIWWILMSSSHFSGNLSAASSGLPFLKRRTNRKHRQAQQTQAIQTLWCPFWGNSSGFVRGLAINILNQKTYKFSDLPVGEFEVNECVSFFWRLGALQVGETIRIRNISDQIASSQFNINW